MIRRIAHSVGSPLRKLPKKCRYCGEFLEGYTRESVQAEQHQANQSGGTTVSHSKGVAVGSGAQGMSIEGNSDTVVQSGRDALVEQHDASIHENEAIIKAFDGLYQALAKIPESPNKTVAEQAINGLKTEAEKGDEADEQTVNQWFGLLQMLPDIGEVAIRTFINPIDGLSTVFQKIAHKAKETQ